MKELSEAQKLLLEYLMSLNMQIEAIKIIMIVVKEPEKTKKLIKYITKTADSEGKIDTYQLVKKAIQIGTNN